MDEASGARELDIQVEPPPYSDAGAEEPLKDSKTKGPAENLKDDVCAKNVRVNFADGVGTKSGVSKSTLKRSQTKGEAAYIGYFGQSTFRKFHGTYKLRHYVLGLLVTCIALFIPLAVCVVVLLAIPLIGVETITETWTWIFFVNPLVMTVFAHSHILMLIGSLDRKEPYRPVKFYFPILAGIYLTQVAIGSIFVLTVGYFDYGGLAYFAVMIACLAIGIRVQKRLLLKRSDGTHILPNACAKDMDEVRLREEGMLSSMSRAGRSSATPASDTQKALLAVDARPEAEQDAAADEGRSGALPEALEVIPLGEPGEDSSATTIKDEDAPAAPASEEPAGPAVCSCQCHTEGTEGTQYCACAQQHWHLIYVQYVKCLLLFLVYLAVLMGWILAFKASSSGLQQILTIILTMLSFIFKKTLLALTIPFPLPIAMLMAGYWIEHLTDLFYVMAYPRVVDPGLTYTLFFFLTVLKNVFYLGFMTDPWLKLRLGLKSSLKGGFTGKGFKAKPEDLVILEEDDINDHGTMNRRPPYYRRQAIFFMYKVMAQIFAAVFYMVMVSGLRYGYNQEFYPFSPIAYTRDSEIPPERAIITYEDYRNSMLFAGFNIIFLVGVILGGAKWIEYKRPEAWDSVTSFFRESLNSRNYWGYLVILSTSNYFITMFNFMYQYRIWF